YRHRRCRHYYHYHYRHHLENLRAFTLFGPEPPTPHAVVNHEHGRFLALRHCAPLIANPDTIVPLRGLKPLCVL
ncbi:hypothetical protein ALC62_06448, partial [Cyphomyrmex costatus]